MNRNKIQTKQKNVPILIVIYTKDKKDEVVLFALFFFLFVLGQEDQQVRIAMYVYELVV